MKVKNLTFSYGEKTVLDGFSLELPDHGVTALSGPSGCGKTTLLRLIAGLLTPDAGELDVPGPEDVCILFQEDRLLPGFTAARQLQAVLPRGVDVTRYLAAVGLSGEAQTYVGSLSGGMRRRVALARALAFAENKSLLLLDEPFTGVDAENARRIMAHLRALNLPILLSAHDGETLSMADQVIELAGPPLSTK